MTESLTTGETLLFQSTRWVAIAVILILLVAIAALGFSYLRPMRDTVSVTYADVERVLTQTEASGSVTPATPLPENVKRVLGGNEKVLQGWLDTLRAEERPQFIRMMSTVIADAEARKAPNLIAVVNSFKELYFERRGSTAFEPYATAAKRAVLFGQILLMGGLAGR